MANLHRRSFLAGSIASVVSAPAIVSAASLMPVRSPRLVLSFVVYPGGLWIGERILRSSIGICGGLAISALAPPPNLTCDVKFFDPITGDRVA